MIIFNNNQTGYLFYEINNSQQYYGAGEQEYTRIYRITEKFGFDKQRVPNQYKANLLPFIFVNQHTYTESSSSVEIAINRLKEIRPFHGLIYRFQKSRTTVNVGPTHVVDNRIHFQEDHIIVRDYVECTDYRLGGAGISILESVVKRRKYDLVDQNPENFIFHLSVDIPVYLPIQNDASFTINYKGNSYKFQHYLKKRGEEYFSTLDSNFLPNFSTFSIAGKALKDIGEYYNLINYILNGVFNFLIKEKISRKLENPILSFFIYFFGSATYINVKNKGDLIAKLIFPYHGEIDIKSVYSNEKIDDTALKEFLLQKVTVLDLLTKEIGPKVIHEKRFQDQVFILVHDFNFYCQQHSRAIQSLKEDLIRDLFIVLAKSVFKYAEAEAFNFDGKLDFKIVNPNNQYELITGEFKWWTGKDSIKEAFHQAIRKHATGQEKEIYVIMLSSNLDNNNILQQCDLLIKQEPEYEAETSCPVPTSSKLLFKGFQVNCRGNHIRLIVGISNLYYANL